MDEIVKRLHEKKQIELAKSILEDNGYKVNKKSKRLKESEDYDESFTSQVRNVLNDLHISYDSIGEEDGVVYVDRESGFSPQELKKVYYSLHAADGAGMAERNKTMWFSEMEGHGRAPQGIISDSKRVNEDLRDEMKARRAQAHANKEQKRADRLEKIKNSQDPLETAFQELVPSQGPAATVAGELVRAMMKIMYRDYNDGDVFYEGYGAETCGSAVNYITEKMPFLEQEFEKIAMRNLSGSSYTSEIEKISKTLMDHLTGEKPELFSTKNTDDYLDYEDVEFIKNQGWMPEYEYEVEIPDIVQAHIDAGNISERDVEWEIESWDVVRNGEIRNQYGALIITGLDKDSYEEIDHHMYQWLEHWGEDLNNEYGDPYDEEEEEEY